jgi:anaerobic selenocysteine-containing dehydrogenase
MIKTACPLDCYDACRMVVDSSMPSRVVPDESFALSNGKLCSLITKHMFEAERITSPTVYGERVSLDTALDEVAKVLKSGKSLLWRGSGNLGVMQEITNLLMREVEGYLTYGSLCDGAGTAGILEGRGVNRQLPLSHIAKTDVVVVWGRNIPVTNSHLMPYIKGKKIVVIDPLKTTLSKMANLHIQIKPRTDFYLAILLSRFITMEDSQNDEWLDSWGGDFDDFYDFTRSFRIKALLDYMELSLDDMGDLMNYLLNEKVVFLVGVGVQRYSIGHYVLWAIDSLASTLGLFGREGCGVSYLGSSRAGFDNPFSLNLPKVPIATAPFGKFDSVIVQGGNPLSSMPNSNGVMKSIKETKVIYFGLYENESSNLADIVVPAKNFLEKEDLRLSYGHDYVSKMRKVYDSEVGISEYQFTQEILKRLGKKPLKDERWYLEYWLKQVKEVEGDLISPNYQETPYRDGFGESGGNEFIFIDDFDDEFEDIRLFRKFRKNFKRDDDEKFWLLSPKASKSLNSQFERAKYLHIPPSVGFRDGERVKVSNEWGEIELPTKVDDRLRDDCVLIYAGTPNLNRLTPPILSEEGENACFGEVKVELSVVPQL